MGSTEILYTKEQIAVRVASLAREISDGYQGRELLAVGVLKGAFVFMADLVRGLTVPSRVDFVRLASYEGTRSCGVIRMTKDLELSIAGQDVLIVEDIVDTGLSLAWLADTLWQRNPASLKVCAFLDKEGRHRCQFRADYVGFTVPDRFIVGYGLDCNECYRNLPDLCILREDA